MHTGWAVRDGIFGGLLAGIVFILAEMLAAWFATGNVWAPLQMIASVPLGIPPALISIQDAVISGGIFHLVYSALLGVFTAIIVAASAGIHQTRARIVTFAAAIGFLAWVVNFYIIAPLIGAPWFATQTNPLLQAIWHTVAYGMVLGWFLDAIPPRDDVEGRLKRRKT